MNKLEKLLTDRDVLLADGATGTALIPLGLTSGQPPEMWNFEHPDRITNLHRSYVEAGSDILVTNSFGGTGRRLRLHDLDNKVIEINAMAAGLAAEVAGKSSRPVVVAGSVGPTGDLMVPLGPLTYEGAVETFIEQMTGLKKGGADLVWIETMSAAEEIEAAIEAAGEVGIACTVSASFDTAGHTMMGLSPANFTAHMRQTPKKGAPPIAFGSNCGVGASDLLVAALDLVDNAGPVPVIAKANAGIPRIKGSEVVYSGSPDLMADYAALAMDIGVRIIGGCCGSTAEHVRRMRDVLDTHTKRERPDRERIEQVLGALVSPPNTQSANRPARRRRRA
ncbi:MAG: betaine--homocysteine S-methyltransferase [Alphaproteobacteria bacterium]|nr:betaine--homocysteine S-methyltransferase [Alphaproteobacteria bacterium]